MKIEEEKLIAGTTRSGKCIYFPTDLELIAKLDLGERIETLAIAEYLRIFFRNEVDLKNERLCHRAARLIASLVEGELTLEDAWKFLGAKTEGEFVDVGKTLVFPEFRDV